MAHEMEDMVLDEAGKKFNVDKPGVHDNMLNDLTFIEEPSIVDLKRLEELISYTEKGSSQLAYLVKHWEYHRENAVRLLREELENLSKQQRQVEFKKLELLEQDKQLEIDCDYDTLTYQKQQALHLGKLLEASVQKEQILIKKLEESIENLEKQSTPVEELTQILKRADNFLNFVLQNAPFIIGHQDKELRHRFVYNHFPGLVDEDIIGKTDIEIYKGGGAKEFQHFKTEVMERGLPAKREITFETEIFGTKMFLMYVEPVFSKDGEKIGVNYMGMEITDQVKRREKMAKLREEIAVQKARETELNKTIHITEEKMRAKQMLATMSHEIRSPLSGVVSMAEILSTTKLDKDQKQLLSVRKREKMAKHKEEMELNKTVHITEETYGGDKSHVSVSDEACEIFQDVPISRNDVIVENKQLEVDAEYDTLTYWKQQAFNLGKLLEKSVQREQILLEKLEESIVNLEKQSSLVGLSQILKRSDKFLHFVLQNAPVIIGHQDKELRCRFIYNHFPSLREEDIIGKTDVEIFKGGGVKEFQDFKREVLESGLPTKREITFETELFGDKTFLIYVEPVFSKDGEKIGVNYTGMEITDQVKKREKMAKLREEMAVLKVKERKLNKTIDITGC